MGIEFSFNKNILFIFIFPIIFQFEQPVMKLYMKSDNDEKYFLFNIFKIFLSFLLSFVLVIIIKFRTYRMHKKIKSSDIEKKNLIYEQQTQDLNPLSMILNKKKNQKFKQIILFLIALSIIGFVAYIVNYIPNTDKSFDMFPNSVRIFFEFISFGLLSYFVLKQKYYAHHFVSIGIIFICLIILFIVNILQFVKGEEEFNFWIFPYFVLYTLLYSSYNVLGKKYLDAYYRSPYSMLFIIGSINSLCLLLYDIIAYNVREEISGVIIGFKDHITSTSCFFAFLLELLIKFIYSIGIWLTIYYLSPWHFISSDVINEVFKFYVKIITLKIQNEKDDFYSKPVNIIVFTFVYVINFLCSLIFNEVIIIKFHNLHLNTTKYIKLREKKESSSLSEIKCSDEDSIASVDSN